MNYILDDLKFSDLESLKILYDETFLKNSDISNMKEKFFQISNSKNTKLLCIRIGDKLVAFLKCDIINDFLSIGKPYMFLSNFCVSKHYRKNGYGTILINEAERIAKVLNCEYIFLTCGNEKLCAHSLYKKSGYNIKNSNIFIKYL